MAIGSQINGLAEDCRRPTRTSACAPGRRAVRRCAELERIEAISDEMRAIDEFEWPELVYKLPPKTEH